LHYHIEKRLMLSYAIPTLPNISYAYARPILHLSFVMVNCPNTNNDEHQFILFEHQLTYIIFIQFFMKAVDRTKSTLHSASSASRSVSAGSSGRNLVSVKLGSPECMKAALVCSMFQSALQTLSQLRLEILAGLCYQVIFFRLCQVFRLLTT
jgi:hypothetical protein